MELYRPSVLEYDDVREAVDFARQKARQKALLEGEKRGEKRGIEIGEKRGIEIGEERVRNRLVKTLYSRKMSLKEIAEYTNLTEKEVFEIIDKP
jgi:predicted transposase YdaD